LVALKLSEDGRSVEQEESFFNGWFGRLRDLCVSPDGDVFLAVSNRDGRGSVRSGDDRIVKIAARNTTKLDHRSSAPTLSVYPNPLKGNELTVEYMTASRAELIIYNQLGAELSRVYLSPGQKKTSHTFPNASGIYFIKIRSKEGISGTKVLKY